MTSDIEKKLMMLVLCVLGANAAMASARNTLASFKEMGRFLLEGGSTKLITYDVRNSGGNEA